MVCFVVVSGVMVVLVVSIVLVVVVLVVVVSVVGVFIVESVAVLSLVSEAVRVELHAVVAITNEPTTARLRNVLFISFMSLI